MITEEKVKERVEKAAQKWIKNNISDEAIMDYVDDILGKQRDEIISQLLGFEIDHWDHKWKINNCNGNSEKYAAGEFIREKSREAVNIWLEKNAGELPKLDKNAVASLRKTYKDTYRDVLRHRLEVMADDDAREDIDAVFAGLLGE